MTNTECDDGNACTLDTCDAKGCTHQQAREACADRDYSCAPASCWPPCEPGVGNCPCQRDEDCDNADTCTDHTCEAGSCVYVNNTSACESDDNPCTDDLCSRGQCTHVANSAACLDDGNVCTDDICSEGVCRHLERKICECMRDADCDEPQACSRTVCQAGECVTQGSALEDIPATCMSCDELPNNADPTKCEEYLQCYLERDCAPDDFCGQHDGVCGVNSLGGGVVPRDQAAAIYRCACN